MRGPDLSDRIFRELYTALIGGGRVGTNREEKP